MCTPTSQTPLFPLAAPPSSTQYVPLCVSRQENKMLSGGKGKSQSAKLDERLDDDKREGSDIGAP